MSVYYKKEGEGKPLFLLHSGGMNHTEWDPQVKFLSQHYMLIRPDHPGHGNTSMKGETLTIQECGESILEIMAKEGVTSAHICGSSMGGATALWLTRHYPELVEKLVLYRVSYYKNKESYQGTQNMADPNHWVRLGIDGIMSKMHIGQGDEESWKEVIKRVSQAMDPSNSDHDATLKDLKKITTPVLIACGDRDPLVPMDELMEMYQAFPESALWIMPYATHITATNLWRKGIFAEELHRFLQRTRPPV